MNPKVNFFFEKPGQWQDAYLKLRSLLLDDSDPEYTLKEDLKWGCPCYTLNGKNVVLIHGFKEYCALLFHKGALMKDPAGLLIIQTENVQATRQMRFTHISEILDAQEIIRSYVRNAIEVEKSGAKVAFKTTDAYQMPAEFQHKLDSIPALKKAFQALTPGRQRGYLLYFSQPKQSKTRESRIEKYMPAILAGKGLNDE